MTDEQAVADRNSPDVHLHLNLLQNVIQRMAESSRHCKIWCVTLVSAVLFFVVRVEQPLLLTVALLPAIALCTLDTYYLALERGFRKTYDGFVNDLHEGQLSVADLYVISTTGSRCNHFKRSLTSLSIWLFYPVILIALGIAFGVLQFTEVVSMCDCPANAIEAK